MTTTDASPFSQAEFDRPVDQGRKTPAVKSFGERLRAFVRRAFSTSIMLSGSRIRVVALAFLGLYGVICGKLIYLAAYPNTTNMHRTVVAAAAPARPDFSTATARSSRRTSRRCRSSPSRVVSSTRMKRPNC